MQAEGRTHGAAVYPLVEYSVQELYETILSMEPESFRFLLEDARRNQEAVRRDLEDPELPLGRLLKQRISGQMTGPLAVSAEAQAYTAAAGEARMSRHGHRQAHAARIGTAGGGLYLRGQYIQKLLLDVYNRQA